MGILKEPSAGLYYGAALAYAVSGYALGLTGLFHGSIWINLAATVLLAHAMTISAYLIHDCGHNMIFKRHRDNAHLGRAMSWLCGAAYGTYEDMRYKHFRHHVDNNDIVWFDYEKFFFGFLAFAALIPFDCSSASLFLRSSFLLFSLTISRLV